MYLLRGLRLVVAAVAHWLARSTWEQQDTGVTRGMGSSPPDITWYFTFCLYVLHLKNYFDGVMNIFDQIIAIIDGIIQSLN